MFGPGNDITREGLATIMFKYAMFAGNGQDPSTVQLAKATHPEFEDLADISAWAADGVAYCRMNGIINGKPGNVFDPKGTATRAELATVILNYVLAFDGN
jgi:hypothetical protein